MTKTQFLGNVSTEIKKAFLAGAYACSDGWQPSCIYEEEGEVFASYEAKPDTQGGFGWTARIA